MIERVTRRLRQCLGRLHKFNLTHFLAAATFALTPNIAPAAGVVELVLFNGKIITVDSDDTVAEALAINDGRIVAVGSSQEILALADAQTEKIDLNGATATPGLIDTHAHFSSGGLQKLTQEDLGFPQVQRIEDLLRLVAKRKASLVDGQWILGDGWDEGKLDERRYVTATDIDPVTGDSPTWLVHTMGHYGTANSTALALAGITRDTPDPPGGVIDRDENGEPTGVLKERAMALVTDLVPAPTYEQKVEALAIMAREFNREGMTAVKDPGIGKETWRAYQQVEAQGELTVRVFALWYGAETLEQAQELVDHIGPFTQPHKTAPGQRLVSGGIKLFADGSGGARTAWVWQDWNHDRTGLDEGNRGYPAFDADQIKDLIAFYHDAGLHLGIHAIGDRAIDWTVAAMTVALIRNPAYGRRHSIIHSNIPTDLALNTMAALQRNFDAGYPESTSNFTWWIGDTYAGNFGIERSHRLNPFRSYLDRGMQWGGGSDFSVTPFPARYGLWSSMTREPLIGVHGKDAFGAEQAVDIHAALRSYTIWAAHQLFMDERTGSLEVGKLADIAVWDTDLYTAEPDAIKNMQCLMTLLEGEVVYRAE